MPTDLNTLARERAEEWEDRRCYCVEMVGTVTGECNVCRLTALLRSAMAEALSAGAGLLREQRAAFPTLEPDSEDELFDSGMDWCIRELRSLAASLEGGK